jgi:AhpD family alkylhydroperoxidase
LFVRFAKKRAEKASTVLPVNVRDLAVYRVSWTVGCAFCVDRGTMLHRLEGFDVDRLKEIGDYATSPMYTDVLSATPGKRSIT